MSFELIVTKQPLSFQPCQTPQKTQRPERNIQHPSSLLNDLIQHQTHLCLLTTSLTPPQSLTHHLHPGQQIDIHLPASQLHKYPSMHYPESQPQISTATTATQSYHHLLPPRSHQWTPPLPQGPQTGPLTATLLNLLVV